jgi:hypothetical protein
MEGFMKRAVLFLGGTTLLWGATQITWNQVRVAAPKTGTYVLTSTNGVVAWQPVNGINFSDAEIPTGTPNGVLTTFTLAHTPLGSSLALMLNGVVQQVGTANDFTLSGTTITFNSASLPNTGDTLQAWYRF